MGGKQAANDGPHDPGKRYNATQQRKHEYKEPRRRHLQVNYQRCGVEASRSGALQSAEANELVNRRRCAAGHGASKKQDQRCADYKLAADNVRQPGQKDGESCPDDELSIVRSSLCV
ncbi:hypothetical protein MY10362_008004 [Beauveria mimosiformis]